MAAELIIEHILSTHPEISKIEILEKLNEEKKRTGGFFSDEVLLRMIAAELGIDFQNDAIVAPSISIKNLIPSLMHITVVGKIIAVFPSRAFSGRRTGKFASLLIADETGVLRVVLWNDKTSLIESNNIKVGQIVRFSHGYTKEDRTGNVELHIGGKCEVEINPQDIDEKHYPTIDRFTTSISMIDEKNRNRKVNVAGTIEKLSQPSTFQRQDSSFGKVMRVVLSDETGEIPVVIWNEKAVELQEKLKEGTGLQIVGARVKTALGQGFELHVDTGTYVQTIIRHDNFLKIASLKEDSKRVSVKAEVARKPTTREVKTAKGEIISLANLELKDETGRIWLTAWRKHAETVINLKEGDRITIKKAYIKRGFGNSLELSTRETTSIETVTHDNA